MDVVTPYGIFPILAPAEADSHQEIFADFFDDKKKKNTVFKKITLEIWGYSVCLGRGGAKGIVGYNSYTCEIR